MAYRFNPFTGTLDDIGTPSAGTVTSVGGGVGWTPTPDPIVGAGVGNLDIDDLTTNLSLAPLDLFPYVDISAGGTAIANQRKVTFEEVYRAVFEQFSLFDLGPADGAGFVRQDGAGGWNARTFIEGANIDITNPTGAGNPVFSVSPQGTGSGLDADLLDGLDSTAFQPIDADLTAYAALATTGIVVRTGAGTVTTRSIAVTDTATVDLTVSNADGVAGNPTLQADVLAAGITALGFVDGTGAAGRVAFWLDGDTITSDSFFLYNSTTDVLTLGPEAAQSDERIRASRDGDCVIVVKAFGPGVTPIFRGINSGGTFASPSATGSNKGLGQLEARGTYDAGGGILGDSIGGRFEFISDEAWTSSAKGTRFELTSVANTTTSELIRLMIDGSGYIRIRERVRVGDLTAGPTEALEVVGNVLLDNTGTASELRLREPSAGGSSYTGFKSPALSANLVYEMPGAFPSVNGQVLSGTTAGVLSWASAAATIIVQLNDTNVDTAVTTLDFVDADASGLVTSSPAGEANIFLDKYVLRAGRATPGQTIIGTTGVTGALTLQGGDNATVFSSIILQSQSALSTVAVLMPYKTALTLSNAGSYFSGLSIGTDEGFNSITWPVTANLSGGGGEIFRFGATLQNSPSGTGRNFGTWYGLGFFPSYAHVGANSSTIADVAAAFDGGSVGANITATAWTSFRAAPSSNGTITTYRGLHVNPSGGTVTTGIGVDLEDFTASTGISFRSIGSGKEMRHAGSAVFGANATRTNASVALEVQSTTQALLLSRMTNAQRGTLTGVAVADGLVLYDSTSNQTSFRQSGSGAGSWVNLGWDICIVKTADQTVTNNATLQDDTELQFAVGSDEVWIVEAWLGMSGNNATGDGKVGFTAAAAAFTVAASNWDGVYYSGAAALTNTAPTAFASTTEAVTGGTVCLQGATTKQPVFMRFRFRTSAATTVKIQFANSAAAGGRTTTMEAGSTIYAKRMV